MLREFLNRISGSQLTAIILAAILVPGAVSAAVTYQPVAIVDPVTGKQSSVDSARRLSVYDALAGYKNWPGNYVEIVVPNTGSRCEGTTYAVPPGKAFVVTAISGYPLNLNTSTHMSGFYVSDRVDCTDNVLSTFYDSVTTATSVTPVAIDFGVGVPVKSGTTLSVRSSDDWGFTLLHGYLVPASAVPALSAEEALYKPKSIAASQVTDRLQKRDQR